MTSPEHRKRLDGLVDALVDHLRQIKSDGVEGLALKAEGVRALADFSRTIPSNPVRTQSAAPPPAPFRPPPPPLIEAPQPMTKPSSNSAPSSGQPTRTPQQKEAAMAEFRARVLECRKCPHLADSRKSVVFGVGTVHSPLMFVGEAPGADEDEQGEPFVGKAGQLLTRIIQTMGLERETVYIANILKCRPDTPGHTSGNRKPTPEEMKTCLPHLLAQIDIIQPRVLVALGATAVEGLLGKTIGITRLRGQWQSFQGVPVMPTYHPAYLLRNQALSEKRKVWEDMLQVMARLDMPISDKQRAFFLAAPSA